MGGLIDERDRCSGGNHFIIGKNALVSDGRNRVSDRNVKFVVPGDEFVADKRFVSLRICRLSRRGCEKRVAAVATIHRVLMFKICHGEMYRAHQPIEDQIRGMIPMRRGFPPTVPDRFDGWSCQR